MNENIFVSCGDFKIKYELRNADNSLAPIGSKPFSLKYFNPEDPSIFVIASFDGNNYVNIVPKVDYYSICLPSPQFNCGRLFCEEIISEIDTDFPSGLRKIASTYDVGEIVRYVDNNSVLNVQTNFATGVWINLNWRFVSALPSLGELKTLYFVPNGSNSDFYIYADESWNKVGTTSIDMSNYFTKADISSLLDGYTTLQYVTNLIANYYLKTETYSKGEVNNLIANIQGFQLKKISNISEVVDSKFIYLLPISGRTNNSYSEYLYINGKPELIGEFNTSIDLSNYVTTSQLTTALSAYVTSTAFNTAINNLANTYVAKEAGKELIPTTALTKLNLLPTKTESDNFYVAKEEGKSLIEDLKVVKLDALPSSAYSQVETQQAINTAIEGVNSAGTRVSFVKEYKNGTLEYIGENGVILQDIYSKMLELKGLPETENEEKIYEISDEPIGNNIYLVIDNVTISTGIDVFSSINNDHYKFEIIQESVNSLPQIKCTCLITNAKNFTAKIKLSYIKYFGEKVSFSIECASEQEANSLELSVPKLKFNKEAIISLTADDASASHYCALFNYISNRKYCLDYFLHHNQYEANDLPLADATHVGILPAPGKTLGFTDGCGIERRMTFDCAIWPNAIANGEPMMDRIQPIDPNASNQYRFSLPYLLWGDLEPMLEFGCSVSQHNVDTPKPETSEGILNGYIVDNTKALTKLGRGFKILTRPDGNNTYTNVSLDFPQHLAIIGENAPTVFQYPFSEDFDMYKILQQRRFPSESTDYITEVIESEMLLPKEQRRWMHSGIHRAGQTSLDYVLWLNDNLGKDGSDVAWITTPDEFYEYWYMRKYAKIVKTVIGATANFDIYTPKGQYFYYPELTFISNQNISGVSNIHDKIKGFSFNGTNMFNVNLDANLVSLAEKYTARFEANQLPIDKQDALYFANQLRNDLKQLFLLRIDAVENVPLEALSISGGNITNLLIGETTQLTAVFTPAGTAQTNIEWSVNDEAIATVDSNGLVTCMGAGELSVKVQSLDNLEILAEKDILCVASRPITGIAISGESNGIINDEIQLSATLTPSNTTEAGILWELDDNKIAEVTQSGLVTLKSVGTVKITAKSLSNELVYDELTITVAAEAIPVVSITVNGTTPIEVGNTELFSVIYNPNNTTEVGVVWKSSNQNVAIVNSSGLVTAISAGTATITATSIHRQVVAGSKEITITPQVIAISDLTITGGTAVDNGSSLQLGVAYTPSNTTQQGVAWSSSDETKATVNSSGLVTAIAEGSVVITAISTINGAISDTHNITINEVVQMFPEVNLMGEDSLLGFKEVYEGKIYQACNTGGAENSSQTKTLYDTNTDTILSGWSIMDNTQKVAAFGSAGDSWLNIGNANYNGVSYLRTYRYAGGYQAIRNCYYGFNVPNGTYRVTIMQSVTTRTDANWGNLPNMGQLLINESAYNMPDLHPNNNSQWGEPQDYIVTDGKLLFKFITNLGKYFGFSCINIKKIA